MIRYICFDVDGVLFSSEEILAGAYRFSIDRYNEGAAEKVEVPSLERLMHEVGQPVSRIFLNLFPGLDEMARGQLNQGVLEGLVDMINRGEGSLYEGIDQVLYKLSENYRLLTASNGRAAYVQSILKHYRLEEAFYRTGFLDERILDKGMLLADYQKQLQFSASECIMIGDRTSDRDAAKAVGCRFIGVLYGHGTAEELQGAVEMVKNPAEIVEVIEKLADSH